MEIDGKKMIIFGGTGNVGMAIIEEAKKLGFTIDAFVRKHEANLNVNQFIGDVLNIEDVEKAMAGHDYVVISLGTRSLREPCNVLTIGTQNIITVMKRFHIQVVSVCLASFVFWDQEKVPGRMKEISLAHISQLDILKNSGLDYIAVCPPEIKNEKLDGKFKIAENARIGANVSKYHLAEFMVTCLTNKLNYGKVYGIGAEELNNIQQA